MSCHRCNAPIASSIGLTVVTRLYHSVIGLYTAKIEHGSQDWDLVAGTRMMVFLSRIGVSSTSVTIPNIELPVQTSSNPILQGDCVVLGIEDIGLTFGKS